MELRQLRYFVTVAEELHFGRAAERLHIVQPAVSQQIQRLERELGVRLFDRSPRTVRLTAAGRRLLDEAQSVLAAADRTSAVAAQLATAPGPLRIGTQPGLAGRLAAVREAALERPVELDHRPVHDQLAALGRGELDLLVARALTAAGPGLRVVPLAPAPVRVALPATHEAAGRSSLALADLAGLPARFPARDCDPHLHGWLVAACRRAGFEPTLARPAGYPPDLVLELVSGPPAWAPIVFDPPPDTPGVVVRSLTPPLLMPVAMVVPATAGACSS